MRTTTKLAGAAGLVAAFGAGALYVGTGQAGAGHENTVLEAHLDGRQEVNTADKGNRISGDPDGRGEIYVFGIDGDPKTLCYVLTVSGIDPATAAHIHEGPAGSNGPVVVNLARPTDGNAADCLTEGELLPSGAKAFPTGESVQEILANPAQYYVNVHNSPFPNGALRGQLENQADHSH